MYSSYNNGRACSGSGYLRKIATNVESLVTPIKVQDLVKYEYRLALTPRLTPSKISRCIMRRAAVWILVPTEVRGD